MTHRAVGSRRGVPKAWLLPLLAIALVVGATYAGLLSRSIAVDFVAWWPVWVVLIVLGILTRGRRWGKIRLSGLVPVVFFAFIGLFVYGHLQGWEVMPSASNRLIGPAPAAATSVALSAHVEGILEIDSGGSGFLYAVEAVRRGGEIGPPAAVEQVQGTSIAVVIEPAEDPGLYTFAGWILDLDEGPEWNLSLGGEITADLSRLRVTALQVNGEGHLILGAAVESVVVNISGVFDVVVPSEVAVRVVGEAVVPEGWIESGEGFASPTPGNGWVISVGEGSSLTVTAG
jgi:hypothetical protein